MLIMMLATQTASAHDNDGYSHDDNTGEHYSGWMGSLADTALLTELSLPGTHDSMSQCISGTYCSGDPELVIATTISAPIVAAVLSPVIGPLGFLLTPVAPALPEILKDVTTTQSMTLREQLDSGIRAFDIRVNYENTEPSSLLGRPPGDDYACVDSDECFFALYHGPFYQGYALKKDVLDVVTEFLAENITETVVMRLKAEGPQHSDFASEIDTLLGGYAGEGAGNILEKSCAGVWSNIGIKLGDGSNKCHARGKLVILHDFSPVSLNKHTIGGIWRLAPTSPYSSHARHSQDDYTLGTNWDLHDKWKKVKVHTDVTNTAASSELHTNWLSASGGSFPYFVASGHSNPVTGAPRLSTGLTTPGWKNSYPDFPRTTCDGGVVLGIFTLGIANAILGDDAEICTISFEGINVLAKNHFNSGVSKNTLNRVGIVFADFPGSGLIESIINVNLNRNGNRLQLGSSQNIPPIASLSATAYIANEGQIITFDASSSSDQNGDELEYFWQLSNTTNCRRKTNNEAAQLAYEQALIAFAAGNEITQALIEAFSVTQEGQTTAQNLQAALGTPVKALFLCDDDTTGEIKVIVNDGYVGDEATATVTIQNVAPTVNVTGTIIDENGIATLNGSIADPGILDSFTMLIDWGEGSPVVYTYPAGTTTFSESHHYLDDNPTSTPSDLYNIGISVTDDDGGVGTADTIVTVNNVAPSASIDIVTDEAGKLLGQDVDVSLVFLELDLKMSSADIGGLDTHTVAFDWADGTLNEKITTGQQSDSHIYQNIGTYPILVTVTDDDTGAITVSKTIDVVDAAGAVADTINDLATFVGEQDPTTITLVQMAIDELNGNQRGKAANGALGMLEKGNWNAALVKLAKAVALLEQTEHGDAVSQLVLASNSTVVALFINAQAGSTKQKKLSKAEALISRGGQMFAGGNTLGAIKAYRSALSSLPK
jgi:1-phosphatidylinositol phosphodiesterase